VSATSARPGWVYLLGAGPGDPELLTLKAARLLTDCDVAVYDRLVHPAILEHLRPGAERIYAGKERANHAMRQGQINALLVDRARRGQRVVRLKGGDPMIFGRGGEEIEALIEANVPFEIVPGVTAASGCAAAAAIPLTHRDLARSLVFATGHTKDGEPDLDFAALCRPGQTIVFYMGHKSLGRLCLRLVEGGLARDLPAALISSGTLTEQRIVKGSLATLPALVAAVPIDGPALVVVGEVVALPDRLRALAAKAPPVSALKTPPR
jgi:uroporphyrin-III C-methyltransferase